MTPLRQRMIEDLQLRGLSERTQEMAVRAVRQLADHCHNSPDRSTAEALRDSFLSLKNVPHSSRAASTIVLGGIKFFYEQTRTRAWTTLTFVRAPRAQKLPVVLSLAEVRTILAQDVCRAALTASGLHKRASVHPLRHSDATPLLEAGVHLRLIQAALGHHAPPTTALYPPLTRNADARAREAPQGLRAEIALPEEGGYGRVGRHLAAPWRRLSRPLR